jgi:hypothetical protein
MRAHTHTHTHTCAHTHTSTHAQTRKHAQIYTSTHTGTPTQEFDAEGLGNLIWSIAALQCVIPEREWMREFVGACHARLRSFQAHHLVQLVEALAVLG